MEKIIKVLHLNTEVSHVSACYKISKALQKNCIESQIIEIVGKENLENVIKIKKGLAYGLKYRLYTGTESYYINKYCREIEDEAFSFGNLGIDITRNSYIRDADIINLHWINYFVSTRTIAKLAMLNRPVVWTVHDCWPFTGGCHLGCESAFESCCTRCRALNQEGENILSARIYRKKEQYLKGKDIVFVAPSQWMKHNLERSPLYYGNKVYHIPNPIDTDKFKPQKKHLVHEKRSINLLFGAVNAVSTPYKGFKKLLEALGIIAMQYPDISQNITLNIFGSEEIDKKLIGKYKYRNYGVIDTEEGLIDAYNEADLFVAPSLADNFPGTVLESLSCGVPVVAFETGGIPDMIEHKKNGYLAKYKDSEDLANGIIWVIKNIGSEMMDNAREKVLNNFTEDKIAGQYIELYTELVGNGRS